MITIRRISREESERRWKAYRVQRWKAANRKHENRLRNEGLVLRLDEGRTLEDWKGRKYGVPPVPWKLTLRLLPVQERHLALVASEAPDADEWAAVYTEIADIYKRAIVPHGGWWRRLLHRVRRSPLLDAPPLEVGKALGFCLMCQAMDWHDPKKSPELPAPPGTSPSTLPVSSPLSPSGATTVSPAPTNTSSSAFARSSMRTAAHSSGPPEQPGPRSSKRRTL